MAMNLNTPLTGPLQARNYGKPKRAKPRRRGSSKNSGINKPKKGKQGTGKRSA